MIIIYAAAKDGTILGRVRWYLAVLALLFALIGVVQSGIWMIQSLRTQPASEAHRASVVSAV